MRNFAQTPDFPHGTQNCVAWSRVRRLRVSSKHQGSDRRLLEATVNRRPRRPASWLRRNDGPRGNVGLKSEFRKAVTRDDRGARTIISVTPRVSPRCRPARAATTGDEGARPRKSGAFCRGAERRFNPAAVGRFRDAVPAQAGRFTDLGIRLAEGCPWCGPPSRGGVEFSAYPCGRGAGLPRQSTRIHHCIYPYIGHLLDTEEMA
jgi:hypothetical protein